MDFIFENWKKYVVEQGQKYIILIPGGFKPPHKGHVSMIKQYAAHPDVERVIVIVGSALRYSDDESVSIDINKTMKIFDLYGTFDDPKIELMRAKRKISSTGKEYENPFIDAIDFVDDADIEKYRNNIIAIGHPTKEPNRGRAFLNATKGAEIATGLPPIVPEADEISATRLRNAIANKDEETIKQSLPDDSMYEQFMNIIFSS